MSDNTNIKASIQSRLRTRFIGQQLYYYPTVTSTMDIARRLATEGAVEGTVVIAGTQTAGRGRLGRSWLSPEGSVALSVILKPPLDNLPQLIMIASLAVLKVIKKVTGLDAQIKWPNDVLVKSKKVCGILIENEVKGCEVGFAIIGIGINVNFDPIAFPEISNIATSLSHELGRAISEDEVIIALLYELEQFYLAAQTGAPIYQEWRDRMETLGKWIQVRTGTNLEQGKAEAVTEAGNLILRRADDSYTEIVAGDVTVIKD